MKEQSEEQQGKWGTTVPTLAVGYIPFTPLQEFIPTPDNDERNLSTVSRIRLTRAPSNSSSRSLRRQTTTSPFFRGGAGLDSSNKPQRPLLISSSTCLQERANAFRGEATGHCF